MMIRFNVKVHYKGTNDKPEVVEFYVIDNSCSWESVLMNASSAIAGSGCVITKVEIEPGKTVMPY